MIAFLPRYRESGTDLLLAIKTSVASASCLISFVHDPFAGSPTIEPATRVIEALLLATKDKSMSRFQRRRPEWVSHLEPTDVLFGRGTGTNKHPGNAIFRDLIKKRKIEYNTAKKRRVKAKIAQEVVDYIRKTANKEGTSPRFLRQASARDVSLSGVPKGAWCFVDEKSILEKTKQALRHHESSDSSNSQGDSSSGDQDLLLSDSHDSTSTTQSDDHKLIESPRGVHQPIAESGLFTLGPPAQEMWLDARSQLQDNPCGDQDLTGVQAKELLPQLDGQENGTSLEVEVTDEEDFLMHLPLAPDIFRDARPLEEVDMKIFQW